METGRPEVRSHLCHCSAVLPGVQSQSKGAVGSRGLRGRGLAQGTDSWLEAVDWWWTGLTERESADSGVNHAWCSLSFTTNNLSLVHLSRFWPK